VRYVVLQIADDAAQSGLNRRKPLRFELHTARSSSINKQSGDIAMGVDTGGAGDQGMMFASP